LIEIGRSNVERRNQRDEIRNKNDIESMEIKGRYALSLSKSEEE